MKLSFKNSAIVLIFAISIIPSVAFASWYNPFTWNWNIFDIFSKPHINNNQNTSTSQENNNVQLNQNTTTETKKENLEISIKDKSQNEINFAKDQISKAKNILYQIEDISSIIRSKYGRNYNEILENKAVKFNVLSEQGKTEVKSDKMVLSESNNPNIKNSAYVHTSIITKKGSDMLMFTYKWIKGGDGDELTLWIDDEMRFVIPGNLSMAKDTTEIDITDLDPGSHILSVALNSYGAVNAEVEVSNIEIAAIKENIIAEENDAIKNFKPLNDFRIEQAPDYAPFTLVKLTMPSLPKDVRIAFWDINDTIKKAESAYSKAKYDEAYAYAHYARIIAERSVSDWKEEANSPY